MKELNESLQKFSATNWPPLPQWKLPEANRIFTDGEVLVIAVPVHNNTTDKYFWDIDKISVVADGDICEFYEYESGDPYTAWDWDSVEYYMELP